MDILAEFSAPHYWCVLQYPGIWHLTVREKGGLLNLFRRQKARADWDVFLSSLRQSIESDGHFSNVDYQLEGLDQQRVLERL